MRPSFLILLAFLLSTAGCRFGEPGNSNGNSIDSSQPGFNKYAQKFSLSNQGDFTILTVNSPWQNASETNFEYVIANKDVKIPDSLSGKVIIRRPLERAVIMSTTFIPFFDTLGVLNTIKGISGSDYIYNPWLRAEIGSGNIRDVGFDQALNYEVLIDIDPDVIFLFGVQAGIVQTIHKLRESGINAVICADYLEPHPLGRSEWLKFFAAFYGQEERAENIFKGIADRYTLMSEIAKAEVVKPSVMMGLPWKDAWYVAGGQSFAARLISDAGGKYIFSDLDNSEAVPFDIESVFSRALEADVWINPGSAVALQNVLDHDPRFRKLKSYTTGSIYTNSKRTGSGGGNDYWESGIIHPDLILKDLHVIFHDSLIDESQLNYYFRLK